MQEVSLWDLLFWQGKAFPSPHVSAGEFKLNAVVGTDPDREEKAIPGPPKLDHFPSDKIRVPSKAQRCWRQGGGASLGHLLSLSHHWSGRGGSSWTD